MCIRDRGASSSSRRRRALTHRARAGRRRSRTRSRPQHRRPERRQQFYDHLAPSTRTRPEGRRRATTFAHSGRAPPHCG
eukprot:4458625-Pyramimonas_sp.AAC.1